MSLNGNPPGLLPIELVHGHDREANGQIAEVGLVNVSGAPATLISPTLIVVRPAAP